MKIQISSFLILLMIIGFVTSSTARVKVPGVVIAYLPSSGKLFLGTPAICKLPGGQYIASCNEFGKNTSKTSVYSSVDKGLHWKKTAEFKGIQNGLFINRGILYAMGIDPYGSIVIRRSVDNGNTWTHPGNSETGLLREADFEKGYGTSAVSVIEARGRIWHPFESGRKNGPWGDFESFVLSANPDADLLNASSWKTSTRMSVDTCWGQQYRTWLEGGAVVAPDGQVVIILRVDNRHEEMAAIQHVSSGGEELSFCPERDFIRFPGGCKKFVIRYDTLSNRYWTLSNWIPEKYRGYNVERTRNTLALCSSPDLRTWTVHSVILQDSNIEKSGFQYADWLVEGNDIIFVSRTAFFDGTEYADNQHNSNFITFHRIKSFRNKINKSLTTLRN